MQDKTGVDDTKRAHTHTHTHTHTHNERGREIVRINNWTDRRREAGETMQIILLAA